MMNEIVNTQQESDELMWANSFVEKVYEDLNDIKHSFFRIGFRLNEANEYGYYKPLGYQNITELAEDKFGFKKTTTYELMQIYELARNEKAPMRIADTYDKYSQSQLRELCRLKFATMDFMKIVRPSDTVADIHEAITLWNKYVAAHSYIPKAESVSELLEKLREPKPVAQSEPQQVQGQLPGQTVMDSPPEDELSDEDLNEPEPENFSAYAENSEEPAESYADEDYERTEQEQEIEIIKVGLTGVDIYVKDAKYLIYDRYRNEPLKGEFSEFIKGVYNYDNKPNFYHGFAAADVHRSYSEKGVEFISFDPYQSVKLTWEEVARHISDLIYTDEYLTETEQEKYIQWKSERDGLTLSKETPTESQTAQEENSAYAEKLNFKNDKARREWLDNFRDWGVWIDVPEVDKKFYRFNFVNGCALIVEIGIEYYHYSIKGDKEIEYKSYSIIDDKHGKFDSHGISYTAVVQWLSAHGKEI